MYSEGNPIEREIELQLQLTVHPCWCLISEFLDLTYQENQINYPSFDTV